MKFERLTITLILFAIQTILPGGRSKADVKPPALMAAKNSFSTPTVRLNESLDGLVFKLPSGTEWKLMDQLGRKVTALIFLNEDSLKNNSPSLASVRVALNSPEVVSKTEGLDVLLALPQGAAFPTLESEQSGKPAAYTLVTDTTNARRRLLGESKAPFAVALIDQAGFLRRLEAIPPCDAATDILTGVLKHLRGPAPVLRVGEPAPDFSSRAFSLAQSQGFPLRLSDYRGQKSVLITFFPRCFTGNCTFQLSSLRDQRAAFEERDVQVIAVSVDAAEGEKGQLAFAERHQFLFPFIPDTGRNLCILYDSTKTTEQLATRMSVFIDKAGVVRWIDKQISPSTHGADVIARIDAETLPPVSSATVTATE